MKITFLGVAGALSTEYNSNIIIENGKDVMLFDCGEDVMHSFKASGRKPKELTDVYISHLHSDHSFGLGWLGFYSYFVMKKRLTLHIHESMVSDLWAMLRPAMEKINGQEMVTLDEYFNILPFEDKKVVVGSFSFDPVKQLHVRTPHGNMYSYGAVFMSSFLNGKYWEPDLTSNKIFISSDTQYPRIPDYSYEYLFCDCDVMDLGGVHVEYRHLNKLDRNIKKKMWLYHYHDLGDNMPDAVKDGFAGFVKQGQIFEI